MGICNSNAGGKEKGSAEENDKNKKLDEQMIAAQEADSKFLKLLLLGAGESGKSTLFKALRSIYGEGFPESVRSEFTETVWTNTISAMQALIQNINLGGEVKEETKASFAFMTSLEKENDMDGTVGQHIKKLWQDPAIQETYRQRSKFQIFDSAGYFFDHIDRISASDYIPDQQDVLRSRVRTTGIVESSFSVDGNNFKLFDVGGQRNERKKWIHCFEDVTAVIFVVGISAYDQVLFEDEQTNRMIEALELFDEISNSQWFQNTSIILFLNKMDLFLEKIQNVSIKECFKEYEGPDGDADAAKEYIKERFMAKNQNSKKKIYPYYTTATDTTIIENVFDAVKDIIILKSLGDAGLY